MLTILENENANKAAVERTKKVADAADKKAQELANETDDQRKKRVTAAVMKAEKEAADKKTPELVDETADQKKKRIEAAAANAKNEAEAATEIARNQAAAAAEKAKKAANEVAKNKKEMRANQVILDNTHLSLREVVNEIDGIKKAENEVTTKPISTTLSKDQQAYLLEAIKQFVIKAPSDRDDEGSVKKFESLQLSKFDVTEANELIDLVFKK